jgi:uncharacterized phage protein gp47/JayE
MLGVARKQEGKTIGAFRYTSYGNGSIPAGIWVVVEGTDLMYKVTADTAFTADSTFLLPIIAEHPSSMYNIGSETPIILTRMVLGLDTSNVGENWIETTGQEAEADDPYRQRMKDR